MPDHIATAEANANFALVKYWGKRDDQRNLPAVGSISLTVTGLCTRTTVCFREDLDTDILQMEGVAVRDHRLYRVTRFLDMIRERSGRSAAAKIDTSNNFPTGAGLASSASGFAALALASCHASGLSLTESQLSELARRGSGSAARSMFGGYVEMHRGNAPDGSDAVAEQLFGPDHWPLVVMVVVTDTGPKSMGSTRAMELSRDTSPFYRSWVAGQSQDLVSARQAIRDRDFELLADISEHSCLKMHGVMMASRPPVLYWNAVTNTLVHCIRELRTSGVPVFFTIDAGPQVKVVTVPAYRDRVHAAVRSIPGVRQVLETKPGPGARIVEAE